VTRDDQSVGLLVLGLLIVINTGAILTGNPTEALVSTFGLGLLAMYLFYPRER
jgi:uncharacterized MnhB-related membrane protein